MTCSRTGLMVALLVFMTLLAACAGLDKQLAQRDMALSKSAKDFTWRIRWQDYNAAAGFMEKEHRQPFLHQFKDQDDLHIVDTRIDSLEMLVEDRRAAVSIIIEYYLMPSTSVKKFRLDQTWVYFEENEYPPTGSWRIVTPFPTFPGLP